MVAWISSKLYIIRYAEGENREEWRRSGAAKAHEQLEESRVDVCKLHLSQSQIESFKVRSLEREIASVQHARDVRVPFQFQCLLISLKSTINMLSEQNVVNLNLSLLQMLHSLYL